MSSRCVGCEKAFVRLPILAHTGRITGETLVPVGIVTYHGRPCSISTSQTLATRETTIVDHGDFCIAIPQIDRLLSRHPRYTEMTIEKLEQLRAIAASRPRWRRSWSSRACLRKPIRQPADSAADACLTRSTPHCTVLGEMDTAVIRMANPSFADKPCNLMLKCRALAGA